MTDDQSHIQPSVLVAEYRSFLMIFKAIATLALIVVVLVKTNSLSNILAIIGLMAGSGIAIYWIKKSRIETAFVIDEYGINVHDGPIIPWNAIEDLFIKITNTSDGVSERVVIETKNKTYKFYLDELIVDRQKLDRWVTYYRNHLKQSNEHKGNPWNMERRIYL